MPILLLPRRAFLKKIYLKYVLRKRLGPELDRLVPPVPDGQPVVRVAPHRGQLTPVVTEDRTPERALRAATKDLKERRKGRLSLFLESVIEIWLHKQAAFGGLDILRWMVALHVVAEGSTPKMCLPCGYRGSGAKARTLGACPQKRTKLGFVGP
jgi:hypothetical protein